MAKKGKNSEPHAGQEYILSRMVTLANHSPGAVIGFNQDQVITSWNPAAEQLFGLPLARAIGKRLVDVVSHQSRVMDDVNSFKEVLGGKVLHGLEVVRQDADGRMIVVLESLFPTVDEDGTVVGGTLFAIDQTRYHREKDLLKHTQEIAGLGSWEVDINSRNFVGTAHALAILGAEARDCSSVTEFVGMLLPEYRTLLKAGLEESMTANIPGDVEAVGGPAGKTAMRIQWRVECQGARPTRLLGVVRDITETRKERRVAAEKQARLMLKNRMASLSEMSAGLAHEINNPMAVISGCAELLTKLLEKKPDNIQGLTNAVDRISRSAQRVIRIVTSLKVYSRTDEQSPQETEPVHRIIEEALIFCNSKLESENMSLQVGKIPDDLQVSVRVTEIAQVLINLIHNALEARELATAHDCWVRIFTEVSDRYVDICVEDNGRGVPEQIRDKIMDPFFTTKKVGEGIGMGLAFAKGLMESHDGELIFDAGSRNTLFRMRFPKILQSKAS